MHKKVLLVQFRSDVSKDHEPVCFLNKLKIDESKFKIINPVMDEIEQDPKKLLEDVSMVIFGGSGQFDLSKNPPELQKAIPQVEPLIKYVLENDFPTLAICFGLQLVANKLGATVSPIPEMAESDMIEISLNENAKKDKIFKNFPEKMHLMMGHKESVTNLPEEVTLLASSPTCPVHAYRYKENIYGLQGHPELGVEDIVFRWNLYPQYVQGKNVEEMKSKLKETTDAEKLLHDIVQFYYDKG